MLPRRPRPASQVIFNRTEEEDKAEETATWKVAAAIYNSVRETKTLARDLYP